MSPPSQTMVALERATIRSQGGLSTAAHLPISVSRPEAGARRSPNGGATPSGPLPSEGVDLDAMERSYVEQALKQASGNKSRAAKLLGLTRAQLYSRLEKYGIT